jgi:hypothetical protein
MSKITADHLARSAYVYVRQSTPGSTPQRRRAIHHAEHAAN